MNPRIVYPDIFNINIARILLPLQVGDELRKIKREHLFNNAIHGIIESVEKEK